MGNVCSGDSVGKQVTVARDPEDKELDAVEMKETKIPDFDSFFEQASAPLNEMVEIHNGIFLSEECLKEAAAAMQGEVQVRVSGFGSGRVEWTLWCFNAKEVEEDLTPAQVDEKLDASHALRDAYDHLQQALDQLNQSLEQPVNDSPTQYSVKRGCLFITTKGQQDALVRDVNAALFTFRKQLAQTTHGANLAEAMKIFLLELSKSEDITALSVSTTDSGAIKIMAGDHELNLKKLDHLSRPCAQFRDALVDLLENVEMAATSVPELVEQTQAFAAEAREFPGKVSDAASSAELGMTEVPKAAMATSKNAKALGRGPSIAAATSEMMQYAARELIHAMNNPIGA